jgi:hypothetical protein
MTTAQNMLLAQKAFLLVNATRVPEPGYFKVSGLKLHTMNSLGSRFT